mmetsp:Transcript_7972/g.24508  ORF Transcript_7972/g.24508 Transcript_7972/m.24508 type:complete len:288 (+) Transcript_7972:3840-4703(+)
MCALSKHVCDRKTWTTHSPSVSVKHTQGARVGGALRDSSWRGTYGPTSPAQKSPGISLGLAPHSTLMTSSTRRGALRRLQPTLHWMSDMTAPRVTFSAGSGTSLACAGSSLALAFLVLVPDEVFDLPFLRLRRRSSSESSLTELSESARLGQDGPTSLVFFFFVVVLRLASASDSPERSLSSSSAGMASEVSDSSLARLGTSSSEPNPEPPDTVDSVGAPFALRSSSDDSSEDSVARLGTSIFFLAWALGLALGWSDAALDRAGRGAAGGCSLRVKTSRRWLSGTCG